ncbi:unnamed protein product (macronuclear) [Paramecium tetraurelia]|uniref:NACHT domain-containing protein n=1 Tax=Paramecium tetraurelia TaxID=5888 RepID=A0CGB3_PARTE|nr:uncharacterized protein GSPATT00038275001 [Paramecium tetraurelia]CAK69830.1 unnamed protein product [Paramecium tetraurelia]|eukprot:XP_001437227.1 hypothetical protein (macronuclear) [Paramecium tetraurelia strain d4-2]
MIKTCIVHCRTNSGKSQELAISIMCGLMSSISQLKPSDELINSIIEGGKLLLLNFYDKQIQNPLKIYEIYYFFENLKWSILSQLTLGYSIQNIIITIQDAYLKYIKFSQDWMLHYCWINLISDLMCFRPIIQKNQIASFTQQGTSDQEVWELLINENAIIQLPYKKFVAKLKIFEEKIIIFKKFRALKLFQEYLIHNQEEIQLLPNYINFNFNVKKGEQLNHLELFIQLLTNQSNLEILKALITQLRTSKEQIISNLEAVKQQVSQHNALLSKNNQIEIKINRQEIMFLMRQIKQSSFLLQCLTNEINLLINKEILTNSIIQKIVLNNVENLDEKQNVQKLQILAAIQEVENKHMIEFLNNLQLVSRFWIQICQFTTISHDELIINDLQLEQYFEPQINQNIIIINNINNYLDNFVVQVSTIKRNVLSILGQKQLKGFMKEHISQKNIAKQITKLLNPNLILFMVNEIQVHFQAMLNDTLQIEQESDIRKILMMIYSNLNIYKGLIMILKLHQRKIISLETSLKGVFANTNFEVERQFQNEKDINEYIKSQIIDKKEKLQIVFKKYQNVEFTNDILIDFNKISNQIIKEKIEIQKKDWQEQIKVHYTLLLSKIQMKLELIGLVQDRNVIYQEIITLLDNQLQLINQIDKKQDIKQSTKDQVELHQAEILKLQMKDLFDFDRVFQMIDSLINKSKMLKRIFQQHLLDASCQNQQLNLQLLSNLKNAFKESLNQAFLDLVKQTLECCQKINKDEQLILDEDFMIKLQSQPNLEQVPVITQMINFNTLFLENQEVQDKDAKVDKIQDMIMQFTNAMKMNYKEGLSDMFQNSSYKVRELLVFNLIKMQSIVQEQTISGFCDNLLRQIWIIEKHPSVRNLLKNEEMIMMQKGLFSKDLQNFSDELKKEMQSRLRQIQQLETQVLLSENQDEMKIKLQQAYDNYEIYLDNITDMSQRLDISLIFLREISKDLKNIKSSIDQVLESVKRVQDDVRRLRGKNFQELLNIRKQKVQISMHEQQLDQVHIQITTQDYDPITGNKKTNSNGEFITFLIANRYDNFDGEVNEFLWSDYEKNKDIMLIKGKAGSGKSRASRNIEELIWSCDMIWPNWIPIYVSLPSLKDPNHNLIEQALESENYNFDKIQVREFKDAIINGNLKVVIILDSYDEMKFKCIGTNLYQTNRLIQDLNIQTSGQSVKIIITTREEILNSIGYQTWFYGQSIETLKEVEILPFSQEQSFQYIKIYVQISIKRTIKKFYEFLKQLKGQNFSLDEFRLVWSQLESTIYSIIQQQQNSEVLFQTQDVERFLQKIQQVEFFNFLSSNQMVSLKKELLQLWGEQRFLKVIYNINIFHLMGTPFMMEIIVYILPKMLQYYSQSNIIRVELQKNFMILKTEAQKSKDMIEKYCKRKINQVQNTEEQNYMKINPNEQKLELVILEQFTQIIEDLDNQNFFESFSLANSIEYINDTTLISNKHFKVRQDANFIVSAFNLNQFTAFDFYEIFVDFYHNQQLQKLKDLGKSLSHESFLSDLLDFSIYLALDMSQRQITQVNYKQKGKLHIQQAEEERRVEASWEDAYFSENQDDFEYKAILRKSMLINSKSGIYAFNHKSIQEYFVAYYLLNLITRIFIKEKLIVDEMALYKSSFNKDQFNLSQEHYSGTLDLLKPKVLKIEEIKNKLIQIVSLSKLDSDRKFIRSASNSLYLLSYLRAYFENFDLSNICLADTKLNGISFYKCNLNHTQFNNVEIDSCNFNCATIENSTWKNIICKEKPSLFGHKSKINQIAFSDDGNNLISSSEDGVITLWKLQGDGEPKSVCLPQNEKLQTFLKSNNFLVCLTQNSIYCFNSNDLSQMGQQLLQNYRYHNLYLSQDGKYLATKSSSEEIYFWQMQNLLKLQQQKYLSKGKNKDSIKCIAISSDSQLLATGGTKIKIWNANNIKDIQEIIEFQQQQQPINAIVFSKDSKVLVIGGNKRLDFLNIENLYQVYLLFSLDQQVTTNQISFSFDSKMIASMSKKNSLKLYDVQQILDQQDSFRIDTQLKIYLIEISPNSEILACCNQKNSEKEVLQIQIWGLNNLHQIRMLSKFVEQTEDILCLKFRNDNLVLGSASKDSTICLWDLQKQRLIIRLEAHTNQVLDFGFSIDGTKMVSCSLDKTIIFWNIINLDQKQVEIQMQLPIESNKICFWPNSQFAVSLQFKQSKEIKLLNSIECSLIQSLEIEEILLDIGFSQDGSIMASLSEIEILRIWKIFEKSIQIEKKIRLSNLQNIQKILYLNTQSIILSNYVAFQLNIQDEENIYMQHQFQFSSTSSYCLSVAQNQKFIAMGNSDGFEIINIEKQISPNNLYITTNCMDFQFSNDSSLLAVATISGAFIKHLKTNNIIHKLEQNCCCLSICFISQNQIVIGLDNNSLVLYDIKDSQSIEKLVNIQLPNNPQKMVFLEKRQQICIYSEIQCILLNLSILDQIQLIQIDKGNTSTDLIFDQDQLFIGIGYENHICFQSLQDAIRIEKTLKGDELKNCYYQNFSQNNSNLFIIVSQESIYTEFEINSAVILKQIDLKLKNFNFFTLNPQETQLIAIESYYCYKDDKQKQKSALIDLETNKIIQFFEVIEDATIQKLKQVIFSQDGLYFISSYSDLVIKLWDAKTCKLLSMFKSYTPTIEIIQVSKRGIIAQVSEKVIKLWNLKALKQQFEMDGHSDSVKSLCISPDGFQLISISNFEIIRWDLIELKKIDTLLKGRRLPTQVCFSPNCQYFTALDDQLGIHIWKLNTKYIIEHFYVVSCLSESDLALKIEQTQLFCKYKNPKLLIINLDQVCKQNKKLIFQENLSFPSRSFILSKNILIKTNPLEVIQINQSELKNEQMQGIQVNKVKYVAICENTLKLAIQDQDSIIIWSIDKKQKESILQEPQVSNKEVMSLVFSGNGKLLFSCYIDNKIYIWDVNDRFVLIKVQELFNLKLDYTIDNLSFYDTKSLQIFPVKDEEYGVLSQKYYGMYGFLSAMIVFQLGEVRILEETFDDPSILNNYSAGFNEANNLIAIQFDTYFNLYDISSKKSQLIAKLEGNSFKQKYQSQILAFSQNGNMLLSLGRNHTIRLWDIVDKNSIKVKINLTKPVEALSFQFLDSQTIRIFSKSGELIHQTISDFTEIGVIEDKQGFDFSTLNQQNEKPKYFCTFKYREDLKIFDTEKNELKYTLNNFSSRIMDLQFTPSKKQFIIGMDDGSILLYQIDKQTLKNYKLPICYYKFTKSSLIEAFYCRINQSIIQNNENENLEKLFIEKGAIK